MVIPDVIVTRIGNGTHTKFRVMLNPEVMPRLRQATGTAIAAK